MTRRERKQAALMSRGTARAVVLVANGKRTSGEVRCERWSRAARMKRAAKLWGTLWALAALSALIPGAHFILVPAFFLGGPIAAWFRSKQASGILGGEGLCPGCGAKMFIGAHAEEWPLSDHCGACRRPVLIEAAAPPDAPAPPAGSD